MAAVIGSEILPDSIAPPWRLGLRRQLGAVGYKADDLLPWRVRRKAWGGAGIVPNRDDAFSEAPPSEGIRSTLLSSPPFLSIGSLISSVQSGPIISVPTGSPLIL